MKDIKGKHRLRIIPDGGVQMTVRCRVGRSRRFGIFDRLRFLFGGRMFVVTINGKEHTSVVLSLHKPTEKEQENARAAAAEAQRMLNDGR